MSRISICFLKGLILHLHFHTGRLKSDHNKDSIHGVIRALNNANVTLTNVNKQMAKN